MFEDFIRLSFLALVGATLVLLTTSYIGFLVQEFSSRTEIVIEPFTIVSENGKQDDERGKALAQALQARLQSLVSELRSSEDELKTRRTEALAGPGSVGSVYMTPLGATGAKSFHAGFGAFGLTQDGLTAAHRFQTFSSWTGRLWDAAMDATPSL